LATAATRPQRGAAAALVWQRAGLRRVIVSVFTLGERHAPMVSVGDGRYQGKCQAARNAGRFHAFWYGPSW
jgi:hypothetical protein